MTHPCREPNHGRGRDPVAQGFGPRDVNGSMSGDEGSASDEEQSSERSERDRHQGSASDEPESSERSERDQQQGSASDEEHSSERQRARQASWIDSHCHVYEERIPGGVDGALAEARDAGVAAMVTVGCDRETSLAGIDLASRFTPIHATVGLHPHEARHGVETVLDLFDRPGVVAVGECGLDYYYDHSPRDAQRRAFAEQIAIANDRVLPLVVHTRDAWEDTFDILDTEGVPQRTIIHCFTGGPDEMRASVERGAYVSFSGIVTFAKSTEIHDAARECPLERMLVETDSPYLAPSPNRGRANTPAWVTLVGEHIAGLRQVPVDTIRDATRAATLRAIPGIGPSLMATPPGESTEP